MNGKLKKILCVDYDGSVYDCDFNLAIGLKSEGSKHIDDFLSEVSLKRKISFNQHCFACTAGCGSSCGGSLE